MSNLSRRWRIAAGSMLVVALVQACGGGGGGGGDGGVQNPSPPATPTVTLTANALSQTVGSPIVLTWSSTNAQSCTASSGWSGSRPTSGQETLTAIATATFSLTCTGSGGERSTQVAVTVTAAAPAISLTAAAEDIAAGSTTILTWSVTDASSCIASDGWGGPRAETGSVTTPALNSNTTFTLNCVGPGGTAASSVTVHAWSAPSVTISTDPAQLEPGGTSRLMWSSTNATACLAQGAWTGSKSVDGSEVLGPIQLGTSEFGITCTNPIAQVSATVSVTARLSARLLAFDFVELKAAHSSEAYFPIKGLPLIGPATVSADFVGPFESARVDFIDLASGQVESSTPLVMLDGEGVRGGRRFRADVMVPEASFRANIVGELEDGTAFSEMLPQHFRPQHIRLSFANGPALHSNGSTPLTIKLLNNGAAGGFLVRCGGARFFAITPPSHTIQVGANSEEAVNFDLLVSGPIAAEDAHPVINCFALASDGKLTTRNSATAAMEFEMVDVTTGPFPGETP